MGARGGGGTRRSSISAAALGSGSPELAKSGTLGVGLNRGWAKEGQRGTRKPLVGLTGFGGGSGTWRAKAAAGRRGSTSPAQGGRAAKMAHGLC